MQFLDGRGQIDHNVTTLSIADCLQGSVDIQKKRHTKKMLPPPQMLKPPPTT